MPWCDACSRFWNPATLCEGGSCPTCGRVVAPPRPQAEPDAPPKAPWHFKLLLVALVLYLGYRAVQGVAWVADHL